MKVIEVKDVSKRITVELTYEECFEIIYLIEREKRKRFYDTIQPKQCQGE